MSTATSNLFKLFDLNEEIGRFPAAESAAGRRAETLVKTDRMRVVLVTMEPGVTLAEHSAPGPITIHVLRGRFVVSGREHDHEIGPGNLIFCESRERHMVRALEAGAFLITISWPPHMAGDPIF